MCRTVASFLRKDALVYETKELSSGVADVVDDSQSEQREQADTTPTVLFRSIGSNAGVFAFSGLACVMLLFSVVSDRWIVISGERDVMPSSLSQGLKYSCVGANCSPIDFDSLSTCGRNAKGRFQAVQVLLSISFALFCLVGIAGAFLTKRFSDLRDILKVLRFAPQFFLEPVAYHTEHPALFRNRLYESVAIDENGIQRSSAIARRRSETDSRGSQMHGSDVKVFTDLWASDSDDERSKSGSATRSAEAQLRRSLKRKELKIRLAAQKVEAIHSDARSAIRILLFLLTGSWIAWVFSVAGTALYHSSANGWVNCGVSICDTVSDGKCSYGPGFATAITGTLAASFCSLFSVLASAFGLADIYACLSATMELSRLHDGQVRIIQQAALSAISGRSTTSSTEYQT